LSIAVHFGKVVSSIVGVEIEVDTKAETIVGPIGHVVIGEGKLVAETVISRGRTRRIAVGILHIEFFTITGFFVAYSGSAEQAIHLTSFGSNTNVHGQRHNGRADCERDQVIERDRKRKEGVIS
jgi:hypothetical protein